MNKHLELLQWCIDNDETHFNAKYTYNCGVSWIHGSMIINHISEEEVGDAINRLNNEKSKYTKEARALMRKAQLLEELEKLNATLSS